MKKIFLLSLFAIFLMSSLFPSDAATQARTKKLKDGTVVTLNEFASKRGAKMPSKGISLNAMQRVWDRLLAHTKFNAYLLYDDADTKNAFIARDADGDYFVTMYRGLMEIFSTEDEIAGVLAHETGHGVNKHIEKMNQRAGGVMIGATILSKLLGSGLADALLGVGANLAVNGYSRENEVEADDYSVEFCARSGFSALGLYNSILAMSKNGMTTPPSGFNSHPPTERRMTRLKAQAERWENELGIKKETPVDWETAQDKPRDEPGKIETPAPAPNPAAKKAFDARRYKEAFQGFAKASEGHLGDYVNEYWAALSAEKLGDRKNMLKWVNRALASNPDYAPAREFKARYFK